MPGGMQDGEADTLRSRAAAHLGQTIVEGRAKPRGELPRTPSRVRESHRIRCCIRISAPVGGADWTCGLGHGRVAYAAVAMRIPRAPVNRWIQGGDGAIHPVVGRVHPLSFTAVAAARASQVAALMASPTRQIGGVKLISTVCSPGWSATARKV